MRNSNYSVVSNCEDTEQLREIEKEEKYVRCLFTWNRRDDAASKTLADCPYDQI